MRLTTAALLLLFAVTAHSMPPSPSPPPPPPPPSFRSRNGVRLVGGSGPRGRLEVNSKDSWFSVDGKATWSVVCDTADFSEADAATMCQILGYLYGRKYYDPKVNFRNVSTPSLPVGKVLCTKRESPPPPSPAPSPPPPSPAPPATRRLLREDSIGEQLEAAEQLSTTQGASRHLLAPHAGTLYAPSKTASYSCSLASALCNAGGPLVGLECSHNFLPPAPPRPPAPPPPPAEEPVSALIRLVGPRFNQLGQENPTAVEPNLCPSTEFCDGYGRVEVLVKDPANNTTDIWAPLCEPDDDIKADLGWLVCNQAANFKKDDVFPDVADGGFDIPEDGTPSEPNPFSSNDFNQTVYKGWVTVDKVNPSYKSVQDSNPTVTAAKCANNSLFAVRCSAWSLP